ncbi:alpha/beta fold hydrolase [Protaetiibacter intestinalis]|uniref:Alpha/beta hydrolase n=1 Tax=Protaetiibacter intestinalis TaxID=2419774 RepID=A0A387B6P0_9MICO|nr:alpha/beta hydrolase [Protaetiibacter intestinalis]AYF98007.1 alpha/beta hydrolase [Protaetiibacter intestinalis]
MPYAEADGIRLFYDVAGPEDGIPLVLLAGTGAQLIAWHEELVAAFVAAGFRVLRVDNRDTGLSTMTGGPRSVDGGYGLEDMGDDVVRVLDAAGIPAAFLLGQSMGGMIAQLAALRHPARVLGLGLVSTIPGRSPRWVLHGEHPELRRPQPRLPRRLVVWGARFQRPPGSSFPWDAAWHRWAAGAAYDRSYRPDGLARQWSALLRAPERLEALRGLRMPVVVMHGTADRVLSADAARDMAAAIPGAELLLVEGMGHELPREVWPDAVAAMERIAGRTAGS